MQGVQGPEQYCHLGHWPGQKTKPKSFSFTVEDVPDFDIGPNEQPHNALTKL